MTNIPTPYRRPLWKGLATRSHLLVVFMAATEPNREWDGIQLANDVDGVVLNAPHVDPGREIRLYLPTPRLHRITSSCEAVLIDGWESPAYIYLAFLCRLRRIPLIYFYRSTRKTQSESRVVRRVREYLFRRASAVLTGGPSSTLAVRSMNVDSRRVVEGVNTVDLENFTSVPRSASRSNRHRYVYVGQLIPRKNVSGLVRAMLTAPPGSSLVIVGDGPERPMLEELVATLGLAARVRFVGQLDPGEVAVTFAQCDTLVLPSLQEVYGLVVPEALAAGLHCVVSTGTGVLDSVEGMRGVFPADPDPEGLADAMVSSAEQWRGPIESPEILTHTTTRMVDAVLEAVAIARAAAR